MALYVVLSSDVWVTCLGPRDFDFFFLTTATAPFGVTGPFCWAFSWCWELLHELGASATSLSIEALMVFRHLVWFSAAALGGQNHPHQQALEHSLLEPLESTAASRHVIQLAPMQRLLDWQPWNAMAIVVGMAFNDW